jgi:hypothetical protein
MRRGEAVSEKSFVGQQARALRRTRMKRRNAVISLLWGQIRCVDVWRRV